MSLMLCQQVFFQVAGYWLLAALGAVKARPDLLPYTREPGHRPRVGGPHQVMQQRAISEQRADMAGILQRLVQLGRAHLNDFLGQRWPGASSPPRWEPDFETPGRPPRDDFHAPPPFEAPAPGAPGLPHSAELARCYRILDLPFGAPLEQVTRQWKTYLKHCHPDRYANEPAKQADATLLTQQLNDAHQKIKVAWERHQR